MGRVFTKVRSIGIGIVFSMLTHIAFGAGTSGNVTGTVTDPTHAVIPGTRITLRNQAKNTIRTAETNAVGDYFVPLLEPGVYEITAERDGFETATQSNYKVEVDQTARVDFQLKIKGRKETVDVAGEPLLQSETSSMGEVIPRQHLSELPLNERNFLTLTLLVPGAQLPVEGSQNSTQGGSVTVNGAREQANNFLLDGVDNNNLIINRFSVLPSVDAIEEFKLQSSGYAAEYGRVGGAQINVALRSGTNRFHGSVFEFFRNRDLDAKNFFDAPGCKTGSVQGTCASIPRFQRNQFGASLGGPIKKDKTFFFVAYESLQLRQALTRRSTVPSQNQRAAAIAALPPAFINPAGLAALNLFPAANVGPDLANSTTFVAAPVARNSVNQGVVKLNHYFSARDSIYGHYAVYDQSSYNPYDFGFFVTNLPNFGDQRLNRGQSVGATWVHVLSNRATNEARFGFNRDRLAVFQENFGKNRSAQLGFPAPADPLAYGYPIIQVLGFENLGEPFQAPEDTRTNTFQVLDNVVWTPDAFSGRHHLKFGVDFRRVQNNGYTQFYSRGYFTFLGVTGTPLNDLLLGVPVLTLFGAGDNTVHLRNYNFGLYIQDDMHLHPRFVLNVGLRYEYNKPPVDTDDRLSVPDLSASSATCVPKPNCQFIRAGTSGVPRATYTTDALNFAPRIGFAWKPLASDRLVIRSAYGMYFDAPVMNASIILSNNPPFYRFGYYLNSGVELIQNILTTPANFTIVLRTGPKLRSTYMQHWNFGVQYEVAKDTLIDVAYVGSKGTHLLGWRDDNQSKIGAAAPFPQFGSLATIASDRSSSYHSLQAKVNRRFNAGLSLLGSYTWSKSIDNGSELNGGNSEGSYPQNSLDLQSERGLSAFDSRHRLAISAVYELPFGTGKRWLTNGAASHIFGGWQTSSIIAAQAGTPFTVNRTGYQSYTSLIVGADRPDQISDPMKPGPVPTNPNPGCAKTISQGGLAADETRTPATWFNPCAFADPNLLGQFRFGTARRNNLTGPTYVSVDMSISRTFGLPMENHKLSIRGDIFNVLNHPNFDLPNRVFDSKGFGSIPSANNFGTRPPRQIQLSVRYSF